MRKGFLLFLIAGYRLFAAPGDTLVMLSDLTFKNETEKKVLADFAGNKSGPDYITLFLASFENNGEPNSAKIHQRISDYVASVAKAIEGLSEPKKVKFVYNDVHRTFFKVYKLRNSFTDIFDKGEYNCVSASALYAIIFSMLKIDYQIMESPKHVYLVAYPQTHKIFIETTIPDKGYYRFSDGFIEKYVKNLCDSKVISKSEYESANAASLFDKYYFMKAGISLLQLAGYQYSNFAVYNTEDNSYEKALPEMEKSYFLFPCERSRQLLRMALVQLISNSKYESRQMVDALAVLCRYSHADDKTVSNEFLRNEFLRLTQAQLIDKSDYTGYDESYGLVVKNISDTTLKREVNFIYHYELARLGLLNFKEGKYVTAHLQAAYAIKPEHANLQGLVLSNFSRSVEKNSDPRYVIGLMKEYSDRFGFLGQSNRYSSMKANCLLELAYQSFSMNDLAKGDGYLKEFEALCSANKSIEPATVYVEKAYSVPAGIYYKKGNYARAKQYLKTGLIYAPDSFGLKQRLGQF